MNILFKLTLLYNIQVKLENELCMQTYVLNYFDVDGLFKYSKMFSLFLKVMSDSRGR